MGIFGKISIPTFFGSNILFLILYVGKFESLERQIRNFHVNYFKCYSIYCKARHSCCSFFIITCRWKAKLNSSINNRLPRKTFLKVQLWQFPLLASLLTFSSALLKFSWDFYCIVTHKTLAPTVRGRKHPFLRAFLSSFYT